MGKERVVLWVVLVVVSGFLGGTVSGWIFLDRTQGKGMVRDELRVKKIRAEEIEVNNVFALDTIRANSISTNDKISGKTIIAENILVQGRLGETEIHDSWLIVNGKEGQEVSIFALEKTGPSLLIRNRNTTRIALSILPKPDRPHVALFDENENPRVVLETGETVSPSAGEIPDSPQSTLILYDKEGSVLFQAPGSVR